MLGVFKEEGQRLNKIVAGFFDCRTLTDHIDFLAKGNINVILALNESSKTSNFMHHRLIMTNSRWRREEPFLRAGFWYSGRDSNPRFPP
jgi:hypothetical protein